MDRYLIVLADDHVLIRQGLRKIIKGVADLEVVGEAGDGFRASVALEDSDPAYGHSRHIDAESPRA